MPLNRNQGLGSTKGNKSPLNLLTFPNNLTGHMMILNFKKYNRVVEDKKTIKTGQSEKIVPESEDISFVGLPVPQNLQENYSVRMENTEFGLTGAGIRNVLSGAAGTAAKRDIGNAVSGIAGGNLSAGKDLFDKYADVLGQGVSAYVRQGLGNISPGAAGAWDQTQGNTVNPYLSLIFQGVDIRSHQFNWRFIPESEKESQTLRDIIHEFRVNSLPEANGILLDYPSECHISIVGSEDNYLYFFKRCMVQELSINYAPDTLSFYANNGAPVAVDINLTLSETSAPTRQDAVDFYNTGKAT